MLGIDSIDKNFKIDTNIEAEGLCWYEASKAPFGLHGITCDEDGYRRMDSDVAKEVSDGVFALHRHTSGGRVTFETESDYIAIHAVCDKCRPSTMPLTAYIGFDLYLDKPDGLEFTNVFVPPGDTKGEYEGIYYFREPGPHKVLIHFPLYSSVRSFYIGLRENAVVRAYSPYVAAEPVVFYGSSITQGGCVSRPGNSFPAIFSRLSGRDFCCFGFSGSAHGEARMAEYLASLPMSMFVMDYDHNDCDNLPQLAERHEAFYKIVRKAHSDIPIVIMSAPYAARTFFQSHPARSKAIIRQTYRNAKKTGEWVSFIDGEHIFGKDKDAALTDRIHPNDFGHLQMAKGLLRCTKRMLQTSNAKIR